MDWVETGKNLQPWATIGGIIVAAGSLFVASLSLRLSAKTNKAKFIYDITESFLKEPSLNLFWYRLDYTEDENMAWKFNLTNFRHSEEERLLDAMLYKFVVVGHVMKSGIVSAADLSGMYIFCRQVFCNEHVREYMRFHAMDFYCCYGIMRLPYENGLYCYEQLTRAALASGHVGQSELYYCLDFIAELKNIVRQPELRQNIANRIGYKIPQSC